MLEDISPQMDLHTSLNLFRRVALAEKMHQLGNGSLGGKVISGNDAGLSEFHTIAIAHGEHRAIAALSDIYYHEASFHSFADGLNEPRVVRAIA